MFTMSQRAHHRSGRGVPEKGGGARGSGLRRLLVIVTTAAMVALGVPVLGVSAGAGAARADTSPPAGVPATASAKALPTWQINGVGWAQVVVGNTVYVDRATSRRRVRRGWRSVARVR